MTRMHARSLSLALLLGASALLAPTSAAAQHASAHSLTKEADLKWADVPSLPAGAKMAVVQGPLDQPAPFIARLRLPAGYRIAPHWHPAMEHVTVLSGTFHIGIGETHDAARAMAAPRGSVVVMPPKAAHFAYTAEEPVELQLHGVGPWGVTYVNPADDPRRR